VNATVHDEEGLNVMATTGASERGIARTTARSRSVDSISSTTTAARWRNWWAVYSTPLTSSTDGEWDLIRWLKNPDQGKRPGEEWELLKLVKNRTSLFACAA